MSEQPHSFSSVIEQAVQRALDAQAGRILPCRQQFLTTKAAALWLNVSPITMATWRSRRVPGSPRFRKLGSKVIYDIKDLREFAESQPLQSFGASADASAPAL